MQRISRRSFLKGAVAAVCTAGSTGGKAVAARTGGQGRLTTLIDLRKCIGCEACVDACSEANSHKYPDPQKPFPPMIPSRVPIEDWSERQDVTDRLTPYNWLFVQRATVTVNGEETELNIPRRCMHCANPPCVKLCPWGAAQQLESGVSRIDADLCLGGSKCKKVCPWDIPQRQTGTGLYLELLPSLAGNGVMYKCDRCHDRLAAGELPACIEACPENVQTIGPADEMVRKAHSIAESIDGFIYGETENGGTHTLYVSPVPFDQLSKALESGAGRPHLDPVQDTMKSANHLLSAMAIAPLAGLGAAAARHLRHASDSKRETGGGDER